MSLPTHIELEIVTPDKLLVQEPVDEVEIPGTEGYFGVLPGHTPLLASLAVGELWYRKGQEKTFLSIAFGFAAPGAVQLALILAGALMMTGSIGPVCAVVLDVVHPAVRATAASVLSLTQNLFGLAAGPLLTGLLSDAYGLPVAMSVVPAFCLAAGAFFMYAARTYVSDMKSAEDEVVASGSSLAPVTA